MARIPYDETAAAAFETARHVHPHGLTGWRDAMAQYLNPRPGMRLLDLGSGTGLWAAAFADWFDVDVIAVEPSPAMRARSVHPNVIDGEAAAIPLPDASLDAAWLSTVVHHIPDLSAAAAELRRVLRPDAPVLIRSAFAGRHEAITLFRYFPEAIRILDTYPAVPDVVDTFTAAGFAFVASRQVPQVSFDSLRTALQQLRRDAHTPLKLISDAEYAAGVSRMRAAATTNREPVVDALDLLVLRRVRA
jgi:SAM-dependent methyltransferase